MGLSTIELVGLLGAHLNTDAGVVAHVGEGGCFHAKADADQPCPFLLFAVPRTNLRDSQGLGVAQASGQVAEATIMLSVITQADDPLGLGVMANAADAALRSWTPSGWAIRNIEAVEERTASHVEEGQTLQSCSLQYDVILERA